MHMKIRNLLSLFLVTILSLLLFGCAGSDNREFSSIEELKDKRIGIKQGTVYDGITKKTFPEGEYFYFASASDLASALKGNKIDAFAIDDTILSEVIKENPEIGRLNEHIASFECAFVFNKNDHGAELSEKMNVMLKELRESGELDRLYEKWLNYDSDTVMYDISSLKGGNGKITLASQTGCPPFAILLNGEIAGYEVELVALFCEKYGYTLEVDEMYFDGLLSAVQSGKADIAVGGIGKTEERAKSVIFSDTEAIVYGDVAILKKGTSSAQGFFDGIYTSFRRTFIDEDRWRMFFQGIFATMAITILSIILGTLLGFVVYTNTRNNTGVVLKIVRFSIWLIQGMPIVVLLMVLYYIVFGKISIDSFWVSVLGFTLTFACSVYNMLSGAISTIDPGQKQAAFTLGYSDKMTFYKILLPQAISYIMPSYKSEIVSLIKATAVVGYIAVQDLTKIGDLIRSRTYEAFFPLIVVTVLYFILAGILNALVKRINIRIDPRKRTPEQILKGVKTE